MESTSDAPIPIRWPAPDDLDPEIATTIQMLHAENNRLRARVNDLVVTMTEVASTIEDIDLTQEEL